MQPATLVSVNEYLATSYRPDRDYVDGVVLERNLGEQDHSILQTNLCTYLNVRRQQLGIWVYVEQRIRVSAARFRIPDICVVAGPRPEEQVFTRPPFLCIEILSKDDRMADMQDRIDDYLALGVPYVWLINPRNQKAFVYRKTGIQEVKDGILRTQDPEIVVPLPELLA